MITLTGPLAKMTAELADPVVYSLRFPKDQSIVLSEQLGQQLQLIFHGEIFCIHCGRKTNKSFQQGYCFPCLRRLQECNLCIIHPERCLVESGQCPEDDWAHAQCHQAHYVYLANTSGLKVGITRHTQIPTRWIDQGAIAALPILKVANRAQAGRVEVLCKAHVADKTNWRAMLRGASEPIDLVAAREQLLESIDYGDAERLSEPPVMIHYPVLEYPQKITSLSLDKTPEIAGRLQGIKGQYLLLDTGVINIRKFGGYQITLNVG